MLSAGIETERTPELVPETDESEGLSEEQLFEVLANPRRRAVLRELTDSGTYRIGELAERVAALENDTTTADLTREDRKSAYTALQQLHLPKLHSAGLVEIGRAHV